MKNTIRRKRKPAETKHTKACTLYTTPLLEDRIDKHLDSIFEEFGSKNKWINHLMNQDLDRMESNPNCL